MVKSRASWRASAAGLAGALLAASVSAAAAEPALWKISDADSTVYLFGTIHLLPNDTNWRSPRIAEAFAASDQLWLEIDLADDRSAGFAKLAMLGSSPDLPLRDRLTADEYAQLQATAEKAGVSMESIEHLRPWLASVTLSVAQAKLAGYRAEGADMILAAEADKAGKPTEGLEKAVDQLEVFAGLSTDAEMKLLRSTISDLQKGNEEIDAMVRNWLAGDVDKLAAETIGSVEEAGPEVYEALLVKRNRAWAERLAGIMGGSGTSFVAVGAAHLIGADSLIRFLKDKGLTAERVE